MTVAVEQLGLLPLFDAVYGSSAGALNAAWLVRSRRQQHARLVGSDHHGNDHRSTACAASAADPGTRSFSSTPCTPNSCRWGSGDPRPTTLSSMRWPPTPATGQAVDLQERIRDQIELAGRITGVDGDAALDGEPIEIDGRRRRRRGERGGPRTDGMAQKATHIVALRTRRVDETRRLPDSAANVFVLSRWFARRAPGARETWLRREDRERGGRAASGVAPGDLADPSAAGSGNIGRTERRPRLLRAAVDTGREAALNELGCLQCLRAVRSPVTWNPRREAAPEPCPDAASPSRGRGRPASRRVGSTPSS